MRDLARCYAVLGVATNAPDDELKRSYRELVREWHPDRHGGDPGLQKQAETRLKEINVAYERVLAGRLAGAEASNGRGGENGAQKQAAERTGRAPEPGANRASARGAATAREESLRRKALRHFREGLALLCAERWEPAIAEFTHAVCILPDHADAYFGLGRAFREVNRPEKAAAAFKHVIRLQPDRAEAYTLLGRACLEMDEPKEAVSAMSRLQRRAELKPADFLILGVAYRQLRRYPQALEAIAEALSRDPKSAHAHYERGESLLASGDVPGARKEHSWLQRQDQDLAVQLLLSIIDSKVPQGLHREGL